jgi:hypothetical protein
MKKYRYLLDNGSRKFICPRCGKKKFVKYIDTETGEYLPDQYGRCDREGKCTYHLNPYKDGFAKSIWKKEQHTNNVKPKAIKQISKAPISFIPQEVLSLTLQEYEKNIFIQNLLSRVAFPFHVEDIEKVISLYQLGTVQKGYRIGGITFPYIDKNNNIRAIQVKQFNNTNHTTSTDFLHSIIEKHHLRNNKPLPEWLKNYKKNEKKVSCLFGEHLLNEYRQNPVALVEAPKTAIYGALYFGFPEQSKDFIWLAVYNKSSFSFDKLNVFQGRDVFVFPDLSVNGDTFKEWEQKAKDYEKQLPGTKFIFSDLLERLSPETDRENGNDIADFLIKQNWQQFRIKQTKPVNKQPHVKPLFKTELSKAEIIEPTEKEKPIDWSNQISEIEAYFANAKLPSVPFKLNDWTTIINANLFIERTMATVKHNNGKPYFRPYLDRLAEFRKLLTT